MLNWSLYCTCPSAAGLCSVMVFGSSGWQWWFPLSKGCWSPTITHPHPSLFAGKWSTVWREHWRGQSFPKSWSPLGTIFQSFLLAICFILLWFSQCLEFTGWVCLPLPSLMIQQQNNHRDIHSSPTLPSLPSVWKKIKEKKKPYGLRQKQFYNLNKL